MKCEQIPRIEGYYLGSKSIYSVRHKITRQLHYIKTRSGNVCVYGSIDMDAKLEHVTKGFMILIRYKGSSPAMGTVPAKRHYEVLYDPSQSITAPRSLINRRGVFKIIMERK